MKILGAVIIICVCWIFGIDLYKTNVHKLNFAKGLFGGVEFLKSEIAYSCNFLGESILKSAEFSGEASEFMKSVGNELNKKGITTAEVFDKIEDMLAKNTNKETYLLTKDLLLQLGEKDSDNHEKMFDGFLKKLAVIINKQNDFCSKECVMFKKIGAVAGIGIAVLLI